jgi:hypothetical protein
MLYSWNINRTFDEFKKFYYNLISDKKILGNTSTKLGCLCPLGDDGESDVMVLVERKEALDALIKEIVDNIDVSLYHPLNNFLKYSQNMSSFLMKVHTIQKTFRRFWAKKLFNFYLFQFYSNETTNLLYRLEEGIIVYEANPSGLVYHYHDGIYGFASIKNNNEIEIDNKNKPPIELVLWLDVSEEPALSRLCIATIDVFNSPRSNEDDRLANGIFLSDIADIRTGINSYGFKACSKMYSWIDSSKCLSIIGSERSLNVQICNDACFGDRNYMVDILRLLALQSLTDNEVSE